MPLPAVIAYCKENSRRSACPHSQGVHTHSGERSERGTWLLGSEIDSYPGKPKIPPAEGVGVQASGEAWGRGRGLEICLQGPKKDHLGRCPVDPYTSSHPFPAASRWRWGNIRVCLFAQGRVVRVVGGGRDGKALVAPRILPNLASSCYLGPGCAHVPVSAPPQPQIPKKSRGCRGARGGIDCLGDCGQRRG